MISLIRKFIVSSKPSSFKAFVLAARPKTLLAGEAPVILGLSFAPHINWPIALATLIATTLMQIGTNYVNDAIDARDGVDTAERLGPQRATQQGWLSSGQMTWGYRVCFTLAFLIGLPLIAHAGWPILVMGIISLLAAYLYTGGPWPLSRLGFGEMMALLFFGPWATAGTFYLQSLSVNIEPILAGLLPGLGAATLMAINNMRDRQSDQKVGKTTLATLLSEQGSRRFPILLVVLNLMITLALTTLHGPFVLFSTLPWLVWLALVAKKVLRGPIDTTLNQSLGLTGMALTLQALLYALVIWSTHA